MHKQFSIYKARRNTLIQAIKNKYPDQKGVLLLNAGFEQEHCRFRQDSNFYYLTGLEEPAVMLLIDLQDCSSVLYVPKYGESRNKWVQSVIKETSPTMLGQWGIDRIEYLGDPCNGYSMAPGCVADQYKIIINKLTAAINNKTKIFTVYQPGKFNAEFFFLDRLSHFIDNFRNALCDVSALVAQLRRTKSQEELEKIYISVDCTSMAHEAAAQIIAPLKYEYEVQAGLEFIFTQSGGRTAFPSIVAAGYNSTILHYTANNNQLKKSELVVVDIGADIDYYCADITRTYPVSGKFNKRQLEIYNLVLDTQKYIESIAKPGFWLSNKHEQNRSLHHLAYKFLDERGYAHYFTHAIGHFLGIDVHDVGDYTEPLRAGDVITIEPGIYIPEEQLGIRIEDNYWLVDDGIICLSQELPKEAEAIQEMLDSARNNYIG